MRGEEPGMGPQMGSLRQWSGLVVGWAEVEGKERIIAVESKMLRMSRLEIMVAEKFAV